MSNENRLQNCFKEYDSLIVSRGKEATPKEKTHILWWVEFNSGFKQASKTFKVKEMHEYKTGEVIFKVTDPSKRTAYLHFADRNESLKEIRS